MGEIEWQPPFELWKHNGGMGGPFDGKCWMVARFTTKEKADDYLNKRGYTYREHGDNYIQHEDKKQRHTMGQISYEIRAIDIEYPLDPE